MLRTIWVWTQEWSDIPSRSAWTCAMYHQARTCSSSLTASRKPSSLRLPLLGALHAGLGDRLLGRLAPRSLRVRSRDSLLVAHPDDFTFQPQTGQGLEPDCA